MDEELPEQIPTQAAVAAVQHILAHGHDGLDPIQHFIGALGDELGLGDQELKAAEAALMTAMSAHPRNEAAVAKAMAALRKVQRLRAK